MGLLDGLTRNWADLAADAPDPHLRPIRVARPPADAVAWAAEVMARQPRWTVVAADPQGGTLHLTHKTLVWRFIDDIRLTFAADGTGTLITGQSRSRVGKGDFGKNRRNLRELRAALAPQDR